MSVQQHYMKNLVELPLATLDKKLEKCRTGKADEDDPVILDIRELVVDFDHVPVILRRIYVDTPDAATLASVGWIVNENDFPELGTQRVCHRCNPLREKSVRITGNMSWGQSIYEKSSLPADHPFQSSGRSTSRATAPNLSPNSNSNSQRVALPTAKEIEARRAAEAAVQRRAAYIARKHAEDAELLQQAASDAAKAPKSFTVIPFPGFVVKARRSAIDDNKIFINVFHHTSIVDEASILTFVPFDENTDTTASPTNSNGIVAGFNNTTGDFGELSPLTDPSATTASIVTLQPTIYIGPPSSTEDKEGYVSLLYNVMVSSSYFKSDVVREQSVHITHPTSVNKIIQAINIRYKENICADNFVLPKVKSRYHGPAFPKPVCFTKIDCTVVYTDMNLLSCSSFKYNSDGETVTSANLQNRDGGSPNSNNKNGATTPSSANKGPSSAPGVKIMLKPPRASRRMSSNTHNYTVHTNLPHNTQDETESNVSDMTQQSNFTDTDMNHIRERRRFSMFSSRRIDGVNSITEEMCRLNAHNSIRWDVSQQLKDSSMTDPSCIVGYQIILPYTTEMENEFNKGRSMPYIDKSFIYVIVDLAKNNLRKTEYKITNFVSGDAWVKLKRGKNKSGIEFRLLRKVWDPTGPVVNGN
eukprot:gene15949-18216_t